MADMVCTFSLDTPVTIIIYLLIRPIDRALFRIISLRLFYLLCLEYYVRQILEPVSLSHKSLWQSKMMS